MIWVTASVILFVVFKSNSAYNTCNCVAFNLMLYKILSKLPKFEMILHTIFWSNSTGHLRRAAPVKQQKKPTVKLLKGCLLGEVFFFLTTTQNSRVKIGGTNYYFPGSVYGSVTFINVLILSSKELFISCVMIPICAACSDNWLSLVLFCCRVLGDQLCLTHWSTLCPCTWVKPINNRHFGPVLGGS